MKKSSSKHNGANSRNKTRQEMAMYTDSEEEESEGEAAPPPPRKPKLKAPTTSNTPSNTLLPSATINPTGKSSIKKHRDEMSISPAPPEHVSRPPLPSSSKSSKNSSAAAAAAPLPTDFESLQERYYENYADYSALFTRLKLENAKLEKALRMIEDGEPVADTVDEDTLITLKKQYDEKHEEMIKLRAAMAQARPRWLSTWYLDDRDITHSLFPLCY
jgi:hypothetical protein